MVVLKDGADGGRGGADRVVRTAARPTSRYRATSPSAQDLPKTPSERVEKYKLKVEGITPDCWDREAAGIKLKR